ncbi:hypothetical protein BLOT_015861 [Blomia tropicalis]|nr:hypothetical protein BLOT_015861 [Blomia tropicalis]
MYKLWFTLIIISILKIDLPFADICIDFNEGDVTIQAAAITEKNIFFILKNRLFIFSFKSYDPGRMNIQLNKRYILNYGIEKLPNVTINDHINSMFVKQRLDDKKQFICYTILSNNESVYCQSQDENEQLMFSKSNGLLQGNQKLVLKMGEQREAIKLDITNGTLASEKKIIFVLVMVMLIIVANLFTLILGLFLRDKDDQKPIPGASQPTSSSPLTMTSPKSNSKTLKNAIKSGSSNR